MATQQPTSPDRTGKPEFKRWIDYLHEDRGEVSPHMHERGDDLGPVEDFRLSVTRYLSREEHEREVEFLWTKVWQWACRANDIPNVGDYLEYEIVGRSVIIVRDTPTTIKAFRNACRHRGTAIACGKGHASFFACPFHGWEYNLDGSLKHLPAAWEFPHFDGSGLRPVRVEEFNGSVFVNLDDDAPPLSEFLGETIMRHFAVYPDTRMRKTYHVGVVVESNWKIMAEAFFESYHIPATHPNVCLGAGDVQGQMDIFGLHHRHITAAFVAPVAAGVNPTQQEIVDCVLQASRGFVQIPDGEDTQEVPTVTVPEGSTARDFMADTLRAEWSGQGLDLSKVSDTELLDPVLYLVFPNLGHFVGPGGHVYYHFRPNGDDHTSMIYEIMNLAPVPGDEPMEPDEPLYMLPRGAVMAEDPGSCELMGESVAAVIDQDVSNSALIQKGLKVADEIYLGQTIEPTIVAFHRNLDRFMDEQARRKAQRQAAQGQ